MVLVLLLFHSSNASVNVTQLSSDFYMTTLGEAFLMENYHTFIYSIPLKPVDEMIKLLNKQKTKIQQIDNQNKYGEHIKMINDEILEIENILDNLEKNRSKRGVFNFIGEIQNYLYGTMSNSDR